MYPRSLKQAVGCLKRTIALIVTVSAGKISPLIKTNTRAIVLRFAYRYSGHVKSAEKARRDLPEAGSEAAAWFHVDLPSGFVTLVSRTGRKGQ